MSCWFDGFHASSYIFVQYTSPRLDVSTTLFYPVELHSIDLFGFA